MQPYLFIISTVQYKDLLNIELAMVPFLE
uniref:Uncharacterized protein n=1 Tax=Arundo donax TaxID=35708 RepID=A0A0A9CGL9_ARUDO